MENGKFAHIVLTRFNLAVRFSAGKRDGSKVPLEKAWLNKEYLTKRFAIFEKYTFESFLRQTDKDFKWIVMLHKDTPLEFKNKIEVYASQMEQFEAWYLDDEESKQYSQVIAKYIRENCNGKVITTRVDNDDAVNEDFIYRIKEDAKLCNNPSMLSYVNGLQYDSIKRELLTYYYPNNHFLSLVVFDAKEEKNNILFFNHFVTKPEQRTDIQTQSPMWVEVITDTNYSNATCWRFRSVFVPFRVLEDFPMLEVKWKDKTGWVISCITRLMKVFIYRFIGLCRLMSKKFVNVKR